MTASTQPKPEFARRVRASLFKRARRFATESQTRALSEELGLPRTFRRDLETLQTVASVKAYLREPVRTIIDVGAHVGEFAETAMRALRASEAVCVEPCVDLHQKLRRRLEGLKYRIIPSAVAGVVGEGTLWVHPDASMSSLLDSDRNILATEFTTYDSRRIAGRPVRISTLDNEVRCLSLLEPFLMKLDTQGTELQVLWGARNTLQRSAAVLVEHMFTTPYLGSSRFADLIAFMDERGFACVAATEIKRRPTNRISGVDFLFCRIEAPLPA